MDARVYKPAASLSSITNDFDDAGFHGGGVDAAVDGAGHDFVEQKGDQVLVGDKSPEVEVQVVSVHLHLLKPEPAERSQPDALEERLEGNLHHPGQNGDAGKLDG